jgi:hypothetical protein
MSKFKGFLTGIKSKLESVNLTMPLNQVTIENATPEDVQTLLDDLRVQLSQSSDPLCTKVLGDSIDEITTLPGYDFS